MSVNRNIRYYKPNDPYYYEVDNLPLQDLLNNDVDLQAQVDALDSRVTGLTTGGGSGEITLMSNRRGFEDLKPYTDGTNKIFVFPGNFISTIETPATRPNGLFEGTQYKGLSAPNAVGEHDAQRKSGFIGRNAVVRFGTAVDSNTGLDINQSIEVEPYLGDNSEMWYDTGLTEAPLARLDLVYIQALPAMDQHELDGAQLDLDKTKSSRARLGIIKGAGLVDFNATIGRFSDSESMLKGRTMGSQPVASDPPAQEPYTDLNHLINTTDWGTVPAPDDLIHQSPHWVEANTGTGVTFNSSSIADCILGPEGAMNGLPICYVVVPKGPTAPTLTEDNIIDIRPFFRSSELTMHQKLAIRGALKKDPTTGISYSPSYQNPFATERWVKDELSQFDVTPPPPPNGVFHPIKPWHILGAPMADDFGKVHTKSYDGAVYPQTTPIKGTRWNMEKRSSDSQYWKNDYWLITKANSGGVDHGEFFFADHLKPDGSQWIPDNAVALVFDAEFNGTCPPDIGNSDQYASYYVLADNEFLYADCSDNATQQQREDRSWKNVMAYKGDTATGSWGFQRTETNHGTIVPTSGAPKLRLHTTMESSVGSYYGWGHVRCSCRVVGYYGPAE